MRRYLITSFPKLLLLLTVVYSSVQCTKVNHQLGGDIIPSKDELVIVLDTLSGFDIYSKRVDSFQVNLFEDSYLGSYISSRLGKVDAAYTTELTTSLTPSSGSTPVEFTEDYVVDTAVLKLSFTGFMGNPNTTLKVSMYELKENFREPTDVVNSSYAPEGYFEPFYSNFDYKKYIKDTPYVTFDIKVGDVAVSKVIEVPLSKEIAERMLKMKPSDYEEDTEFREIFKGFCFVTETVYGGGALMVVDPNNSNIVMEVYDNKVWEEEEVKNMINVSFDFAHIYLGELYSQMVTSFDFDASYANAPIAIPESVINDSISNISSSYISGFGNVVTRLKFPIEAINSLKEQLTQSPSSAIIVTNATLELPTFETNIGALNYSIVQLGTFYDFSTSVPTPDYFLSSDDGLVDKTFDGKLNRSYNKYEMNITSYIQEVLNGKTDEISIDIAPSSLIADQLTRLSNLDNRKIILKLTYCVAE